MLRRLHLMLLCGYRDLGSLDDVTKTVKKLEEALTPAEKAQLYEAIDYQVTPLQR